MIVKGTATISAEGRVDNYRIDHRETLPKGVVEMIDRAVPTWRFAPVAMPAGQAVPVMTMSIQLVAGTLDDGRTRIDIRHAQFTSEASEARLRLDTTKFKTPSMPFVAREQGLSAMVYLIVRVGRDGKATDIAVEQVNLMNVGSAVEMRRWRDAFARTTLASAKSWTYLTPTTGADAQAPYWIGRIPVLYRMILDEELEAASTRLWEAYVPGERTRPAWADDAWSTRTPEALPSGMLHTAGGTRELLTPLSDD